MADNMLLTITLVLLGTSILVFFSQEFGKAAKKLFSYPGVTWCLPVFLASFLVVSYEHWVLWGLLKIKALLHLFVEWIVDILPFTTGEFLVAKLLVLMVLTILPVWALNIRSIRKTFKPYKHPYLLSALIWITVAMLLSVPVQ
ncbi:hypothetical protein [Legionella spiritensis]|uniref:Uncharacterized protein n=1 Tax=Legionella spiritensis TaxID=452 RepID=A0A0W0YY32_LEGSP|nr:hypothetical protein [Legionella spiritensis]KTD61507.1 hypothetical protein Lspi_2137 [Legionella spiritensis]SNV32979.1 Uncharacterised protein [Legionella spiritensis]